MTLLLEFASVLLCSLLVELGGSTAPVDELLVGKLVDKLLEAALLVPIAVLLLLEIETRLWVSDTELLLATPVWLELLLGCLATELL